MNNCEDCSHAPHEPNRCKSCNCGEAEICNLNGQRELTLTGIAEDSSLTYHAYDCGHVVETPLPIDPIPFHACDYDYSDDGKCIICGLPEQS